jgi:hypothetical protein
MLLLRHPAIGKLMQPAYMNLMSGLIIIRKEERCRDKKSNRGLKLLEVLWLYCSCSGFLRVDFELKYRYALSTDPLSIVFR